MQIERDVGRSIRICSFLEWHSSDRNSRRVRNRGCRVMGKISIGNNSNIFYLPFTDVTLYEIKCIQIKKNNKINSFIIILKHYIEQ